MDEKTIADTHTERIICPECDTVQDAEVVHTQLWNSYVHTCINCEYVIMGSEWQEVEEEG